MRKVIGVVLAAAFVLLATGCTPKEGSVEKNKTVTLKLAHNLNEQHSVHLALKDFAEKVEELSNGTMKVQIYPNGQLGSESEVLEQLKAGAVTLTKVSAAALTPYSDGYNAFTLPYVFADEDHYFTCMESDAVQNLYNSTADKGFVGLTFYNSGARSFYTTDKVIMTPADLAGEKIRVMGFQSQTDMVDALGGTPVGMSYGEVYTSLQSGVIDGAESNETALTNGKHGEVAKNFSLDEHTRIPDILVISSKVMDSLTDEQKAIIKEAAAASTEMHKVLWKESIDAAVKEAKETMNVQFYNVDKAPFRIAVQPVLDKYSSEYPEVKELLNAFKKLEK
jgi:tripartite ATP-independent transporter DctP family solute receptor